MGLQKNIDRLLQHEKAIKLGILGANQNYQIFLKNLTLKEKQELTELYYFEINDNDTFEPEIHSEEDCNRKLSKIIGANLEVIFSSALDHLNNKLPNIARKLL